MWPLYAATSRACFCCVTYKNIKVSFGDFWHVFEPRSFCQTNVFKHVLWCHKNPFPYCSNEVINQGMLNAQCPSHGGYSGDMKVVDVCDWEGTGQSMTTLSEWHHKREEVLDDKGAQLRSKSLTLVFKGLDLRTHRRNWSHKIFMSDWDTIGGQLWLELGYPWGTNSQNISLSTSIHYWYITVYIGWPKLNSLMKWQS